MAASKLGAPTFEVDLEAVLSAWDSRRARSKQKKPGPSSLGTCRRRMAYQIVRQRPDNGGDKKKAIQGTLLHRGVLAALKTAHGGLTEVKLEDERVRGSCDWLRYDPLGLAIVSDVKTVGKDVYEPRIRGDISKPHLWQTMTYGDLLRRGAIAANEKRIAAEPVDVVDVEIITLCRDDGRSESRRIPFQQDVADEAWAWLTEVEDRVAVDGVNLVPRDEAGPDNSYICPSCPFLNACWGEQDNEGRRRPLLLPSDELRDHLVAYEEARLVEKEAAARKKLARAHLDGQDPQKTSDGWSLGWTGGKVTTSEVVDVEGLVGLVESAGLAVPMRTIEKVGPVSIAVKPPKRTGA